MRSVTGYLTDVDKQLREDRKARIFDLWMSCATQEEIGEAVGLSQPQVKALVEELSEMATLPNPIKVTATFAEADWTPPLYNVWTFSRKSAET